MSIPGPAVLASEPGKVLVELPQPDFRGPRATAFIEALQSFEPLGITRCRRLRDGIIVTYDDGALEVHELRALLLAASSKVKYMEGDFSPSTHILPVTFGGSFGPDLSMASVLLDSAERTLIRRMCRSRHTVRSFAGPGASVFCEVPWSKDWLRAQPDLSVREVPRGSLTLSAQGVTVTSRRGYTNELVVGRVRDAFLDVPAEIRMGDSVWLRLGKRCLPNDS
ncbi:allophanate hydrolase subunit 1 [Pseudarthrobacter sp. PvP004]|nr:allophanate hydrolase subunit 1 [Pseudarthrobacter sp. PvP004]